MVDGARDRMLDGTVRLLATKGLQSTSFSEVLALTGAPRGSVYHHFPEGKDQMVAEALDRMAAQSIAAIDEVAGQPADVVAARFLDIWRALLTRSSFRAGCAALAVTVATDSDGLLEHTAAFFRGWRARLGELLAEGGLPDADADGTAIVLLAASEGAVVMARAERTTAPLDVVEARMLADIRTRMRR